MTAATLGTSDPAEPSPDAAPLDVIVVTFAGKPARPRLRVVIDGERRIVLADVEFVEAE